MDNYDEMIMSNVMSSGDFGLKQLLQVWRDYYDEIFEVNLTTGEFRTMMGNDNQYWTQNGFVEIEVILLAEQRIHPDDKEAFANFFDLDLIRENLKRGIYVSKLNFRLKNKDGEYVWMKVKNMIPTTQDIGDIRFFACFRKADKETDETLRMRQEISDALENEKKLSAQKTALIDTIASQIRSPLSGIIGMAGLAAEDVSDSDVTQERLLKIKDEAKRLSRILTDVLKANHIDELPDIEYDEQPVNQIQYIHGDSLALENEGKDNGRSIPENFVYVSDKEEGGMVDMSKFDFTGKKILVCEANSLNVTVITELLGKAGATVVAVDNGKSAVIEFVSKPAYTYDIALMGIDTAVLSGDSAAKCIRISGKDDAAEIPLFAVTSKDMPEDIIKAYESGFNAYFKKPVDFNMLFTKMAEQFES
ncbi:MAG: response regulator [Lachnospiraceae bacterium]|nr:response regulator [Lachnospiraceae bacterium]